MNLTEQQTKLLDDFTLTMNQNGHDFPDMIERVDQYQVHKDDDMKMWGTGEEVTIFTYKLTEIGKQYDFAAITLWMYLDAEEANDGEDAADWHFGRGDISRVWKSYYVEPAGLLYWCEFQYDLF